MSGHNQSTNISADDDYLANFSTLLGNQTDNFSFADVDYLMDFFDIWDEYLRPQNYEIIVIVLYAIVFLVSLIGNSLIIVYILRRRYLQTVVNYLMLNLTVADFLVTIICLPPTLMLDVFETWLLGKGLCALVPYLQMTVTSVSSLSLGAIAINRWFIVCRPLKVTGLHKSPFATKVYMVLVWVYSLATLCPIALVMKLSPTFEGFEELSLFQSCTENWQSFESQAIFHSYYLIVCYALPLVILAINYTLIFRNLSTSQIPGYSSGRGKKDLSKRCSCSQVKKESNETNLLEDRGFNAKETNRKTVKNDTEVNEIGNDSKSNEVSDKHGKQRFQKHRIKNRLSSKSKICRKCQTKINLLRSRRRSAYMQVTLIIVFAICFAPALILDIVRHSGHLNSVDRQTIHFVFSLAHLLLYVNSALNPIIYNFFSVHFRNEFRKTFRCCRSEKQRNVFAKRPSFNQNSRWDYVSTKPRESAKEKRLLCCTVRNDK